MKIVDLLNRAKKQSKLLEAELLLADFLHKDRSFLFANSEMVLAEEVVSQFNNIWPQVLDGYPLAYLFKSKEFYGRDFYVDERVLIPRPETECLIDEVLKRVLKEIEKKNVKLRLVDVGTGSGCIGISLALELAGRGVDRDDLELSLCDISADALEVAKINAVKFDLLGISEFKEGVLLAHVNPAKAGIYTLLVANLPYIGTSNNNFIQKSVDKYEPHLALYSGEDGLDDYRRLLDQIADLRPDLVAMEFGQGQELTFEELIQKQLPNYNYNFYSDLAGIVRGVVLEK